MKGIEYLRKRIRLHRHGYKVYMVVHETIGPYLEGMSPGICIVTFLTALTCQRAWLDQLS
jgi:hypothetical protein